MTDDNRKAWLESRINQLTAALDNSALPIPPRLRAIMLAEVAMRTTELAAINAA